MAIHESEFESEAELEQWAKREVSRFFSSSLLLDGFRITTLSGKHGIPDGFSFNFEDDEWHIIECELLKHGVWPHIAEQITRFVVAAKNPEAHQIICDRAFERILRDGSLSGVATALGVDPERVYQRIQSLIQTTPPRIAIFIDDVNRDLEDMANALDASTSIYRVKKLLIDGRTDYYSPDEHGPVIAEEPGSGSAHREDADVLDSLGGGRLKAQVRRFRCYETADGEVINIKTSKLYPAKNYYWYGISAASRRHMAEHGVTHVVFVMGERGFIKVPLSTVEKYLATTKSSLNPDGSIRHHHVLVSNEDTPELFWSAETARFPLTDEYFEFD